jgi:hypothetical protein
MITKIRVIGLIFLKMSGKEQRAKRGKGVTASRHQGVKA